ncbi:MAG: PAS domain S-box protein, partial [Endomicrobiales bacterium]
YRIVRDNDHAERWVHGLGRLGFDEKGHVVKMHGTIQDITERIHAQEMLRQSEERYKRLIETTRTGYVILDVKGRVVEANLEFLRMTGRKKMDEIVGHSVLEWTAPYDVDRGAVEMKKICEQGFGCNLEIDHVTPDGTIIPIEINSTVLHTGNTVQIQTLCRDITKRKQDQNEIRHAHEHLKCFVDANIVGVVIATTAGSIIEANDYYLNMTGYTREEFNQGLVSWKAITPPEWLSTNERAFDELRKRGVCAPYEKEYVRRDGTRVPVLLYDAMLPGPDERLICFVLDMTDHKRMEEEIRKTQKLDSLGILAGGIAHDFNNILTGILGNISLVRYSMNPADNNHQILNDAEQAALRAKNLSHQLLTFAKGGVPIKKVTALAGIIKETVTFSMHGSQAVCEFHFDQDLSPVEIDPDQIGQVIGNIVINAVQAMPNGGEISVTAENVTVSEPSTVSLKAGSYVRIVIKDTGVGIAPNVLGKVFDPYFTTKDNGTGIGLAAAYSIIRNHDGYITAVSELGKGASFIIYLPAAAGPIESAVPVRASVGTKTTGRILILDDEEIVRVLGQRMLSKLGYYVETFSESDKAVERYQHTWGTQESFDAVILDITIPGYLGGKEVLDLLKKVNPAVKAVISSGYSADPIIAQFKQYGFLAALPKPYNIEEASAVLNKLLE